MDRYTQGRHCKVLSAGSVYHCLLLTYTRWANSSLLIHTCTTQWTKSSLLIHACTRWTKSFHPKPADTHTCTDEWLVHIYVASHNGALVRGVSRIHKGGPLPITFFFSSLPFPPILFIPSLHSFPIPFP